MPGADPGDRVPRSHAGTAGSDNKVGAAGGARSSTSTSPAGAPSSTCRSTSRRRSCPTSSATCSLTVRAEVPYGETVTYGELAELAGRPGAARAVGTAMARNPVPFFVPCHRVVAAGGIGGYGGGAQGVALKRALLDLEARGRPSG